MDSILAAMRAAETGHLVFGTLHANNASQTVGQDKMAHARQSLFE